MDHHGHDSMSSGMYFNFMYPITVLFQGWKITEEGALIGSCFGVLGFAMAYELLKNFRKWENQRMFSNLKEDNSSLSSKDKRCGNKPSQLRNNPKFWIHHAFQSALHSVQVFLGYCLMLIAMTFNVWLLIATVVGAGIGYLLGEGMLMMYENDSEDENSFKSDDEYATKESTFSVEKNGYVNHSF